MKKDKEESLNDRYKHFIKVGAKNRLIFSRRLHFEYKFRDGLKKLLEKYNKGEDVLKILGSTFHGENQEFLDANRLHKESWSKIREFDHKKGIDFIKTKNKFLEEFSLGKEWTNTIITLILNNKFCPPLQNFYISKTGKSEHEKVVLTLNPDTSLDDIKYSFEKIKKLQKELSPKFKKVNITEQSFKRFYEVANFDIRKYIEADKENLAQLTTGEEIIYKKYKKNSEAVKLINHPSWYVPRRKKLFKPKLKFTDKQLIEKRAKELKKEGKKTNQKKYLNWIQQERKRQKP